MRRTFPFVVALFAAFLAVGTARADEVEDLIQGGIKLRREGKDAEALPLFRRAYGRTPSPRAAAQLGLVQQALGMWLEAERHLSAAMAATADPWVAKNRTALADNMRNLERHLATLEVRGTPDGAEVSIDGQVVGRLPIKGSFRVLTGELRLKATAPGFEPAIRTIVTAPRVYTRETINLIRRDGATANEAGPAAASASLAVLPAGDKPSSPSTPQGRPPWLRGAAWGAAVAGAGALGLGVYQHARRQSLVKEFNRTGTSMTLSGSCDATVPDGGSPRCATILDDVNVATTRTIVGYVAGAGLTAAAAWLFVRSGSSNSEQPKTDLAWTCGPAFGASGAACRLQF